MGESKTRQERPPRRWRAAYYGPLVMGLLILLLAALCEAVGSAAAAHRMYPNIGALRGGMIAASSRRPVAETAPRLSQVHTATHAATQPPRPPAGPTSTGGMSPAEALKAMGTYSHDHAHMPGSGVYAPSQLLPLNPQGNIYGMEGDTDTGDVVTWPDPYSPWVPHRTIPGKGEPLLGYISTVREAVTGQEEEYSPIGFTPTFNFERENKPQEIFDYDVRREDALVKGANGNFNVRDFASVPYEVKRLAQLGDLKKAAFLKPAIGTPQNMENQMGGQVWGAVNMAKTLQVPLMQEGEGPWSTIPQFLEQNSQLSMAKAAPRMAGASTVTAPAPPASAYSMTIGQFLQRGRPASMQPQPPMPRRHSSSIARGQAYALPMMMDGGAAAVSFLQLSEAQTTGVQERVRVEDSVQTGGALSHSMRDRYIASAGISLPGKAKGSLEPPPTTSRDDLATIMMTTLFPDAQADDDADKPATEGLGRTGYLSRVWRSRARRAPAGMNTRFRTASSTEQSQEESQEQSASETAHARAHVSLAEQLLLERDEGDDAGGEESSDPKAPPSMKIPQMHNGKIPPGYASVWDPERDPNFPQWDMSKLNEQQAIKFEARDTADQRPELFMPTSSGVYVGMRGAGFSPDVGGLYFDDNSKYPDPTPKEEAWGGGGAVEAMHLQGTTISQAENTAATKPEQGAAPASNVFY